MTSKNLKDEKSDKTFLLSTTTKRLPLLNKQGYASYCKTLGKGLGLVIVSEKPLLEVVDLPLPHIKAILVGVCEEAKLQMQSIENYHLGSWERTVTTCDGCWQIRGHFSQNCTFVIKNYITGGLLYYGYLF